MECPKGKIKRKSYKRQSSSGKKTHVKAKCIAAISQSGQKRTDLDKKLMSREKREHTIARKKFGTPKCPKGYIIKEGYHKKASSKSKGVWVAPTCIKARGLSKKRGSKGKKLFRLEKGTLGQYGYKDIKRMTKKKRRSSLKRAVKNMKPLSVRRKLIALGTLNKNTNPDLSRTFREDADWVKETPEYKNRNE